MAQPYRPKKVNTLHRIPDFVQGFEFRLNKLIRISHLQDISPFPAFFYSSTIFFHEVKTSFTSSSFHSLLYFDSSFCFVFYFSPFFYIWSYAIFFHIQSDFKIADEVMHEISTVTRCNFMNNKFYQSISYELTQEKKRFKSR